MSEGGQHPFVPPDIMGIDQMYLVVFYTGESEEIVTGERCRTGWMANSST